MQLRNLLGFSMLATTLLVAQQPDQDTTRQPQQSDQPTTRQTDQQTPRQTTDHPEHGTASSARSDQSGPQSMLSPKDQKFLTEAARGGMMEIQIAQMAQQKAASDEVKQFARQLEQDHSKANEQLKAIAQERGVELPTDLGHHEKSVSMLTNASGEEFDRMFMKMQVQHHKKDLNQFRKQAKSSIDTDLREFANANVPVLEQHLRQAQTLASQTGTRARTK